jgi:hypothetical protein
VKTPYGYHIIKVEAHTTKSFEQVRPEIEKMPPLIQAKVQKALDEMTKGAFYDPEFFAAPKPPAPPTLSAPPAAPKPAVAPTPLTSPTAATPAAAPQK